MPPGPRPRTRHLQPDGTPRHTNALADETSPYLLQHAHNPVQWRPWGDEAFAEARRRDVPVFLSVGYATCHWCHVMEEESFEDEAIAAALNERFVCVKVDREERPDVDAAYMAAVQALTGRGGWPMSVWLTPHDRRPFFAGTYWPARDGDRGARTGFLTVLTRLAQAWQQERAHVVDSAAAIAAELAAHAVAARPAAVPGADAVLDQIAAFVAGRFDERWGGLRGAPKFPSSTPVRLLLRHAAGRPGPHGDTSRRMALLTLDRMTDGGVFDQLAGGLHRYSVDERWQVPHFEKMLYDNALAAMALVEAWQVTGEPRHERAARATLRFIDDELSLVQDGRRTGFLSATDADSVTPTGQREEGFFFTWTRAELAAELHGVLDDDDIAVVAAAWDVTDGGNFEGGRSVLWHREPIATVARRCGRTVDAVHALLERARPALLRGRRERPAPLTDDKVIASWNGLAVSAFARAAFAFDDDDLAARARAGLDFVLLHLRRADPAGRAPGHADGHPRGDDEADDRDGEVLRLHRAWRCGRARHDGVLDDHAFVARACLDVFELDGDVRRLRQARALDRAVQRFFADDDHGGFFATARDAEALLTREKPDHDGVEPSGNSVHADTLVRLALLLSGTPAGDDAARRAERCFGAFGQRLQQAPPALAELAMALHAEEHGREIVVVRPPGALDDEGRQLLRVLRRRFLPARVVLWGDGQDDRGLPLLRGRVALDGRVTVYVCEQGRCRRPATSSRELLEALA
jgi:uncharacterized protein YyaL (SSP411 family)